MKQLIVVIFFVYFWAAGAFADAEKLIFIGNPGVGKSTLINSLLERKVADAGVNAGVGMTKFFSAYEHAGKYYFDTPGLADVELRAQAAVEIEQALKKDGIYRIFFIITLQAGRVRPEDVVTINTVMDAIDYQYPSYNIIINMLTPKEKKLILGDKVNMASVYAQLNSGKHKTQSIMFIDQDRNLEDELSEYIKIDTLLAQFIHETSTSIAIDRNRVNKINIDEYDAIREQFAQTIAELKQEIKEGNEKYAQLFTQITQMQAQYAAAVQNLIEQSNHNKRLREKYDSEKDRRPAAELDLAATQGTCILL